jgi:hypothetical protein
MGVSDIAETREAKSLTRECRDTEDVETSLGDRLCRFGDEDEACDSDCGSHDCRKVEDPRPSCVLNE